MKKILLFIILILTLSTNATAQKVGLVMSGGGARGLAHIGVIKALEENNIPIDYVAGTSMGAIIASLYAMGYTPEEMEEIIASDKFKRWYSGKMSKDDIFYFRRNEERPDILNLRIETRDSLRVVIPTPNLIDPTQMNLGFLEMFAAGNAACKSNFDSLMVPFRCVASDVYNKKQIIYSDGDLSDAVRASMTFPFVFKPIKKDSVLVYDGGIYNNFPADVMQRDFNPDFIIGSVVSKNPPIPKETDIMSQLENLIMDKSNYLIPDSSGIVINMKLDEISLLEFDKLQKLSELGYMKTSEMMDSIKQNVSRRTHATDLKKKRERFKSRMPEMRFKRIEITGIPEEKQKYILREFHNEEDEIFSFNDCKKAYFRLLTGNVIASMVPHATYNEKDSTYTLHLNVEMREPLSLRVGGAISTGISNQIFFGANYRSLKYQIKEFILDGQVGNAYNNIQLSGRQDFSIGVPATMRLTLSHSLINYYNKYYMFAEENNIVLNRERESYAKLKISLPFLMRQKAEFGIGVADIKDEYIPSNNIDLEMPNQDRNKLKLFGGLIKFEGNTLDTKAYPTNGLYESLVAQVFTGQEKFYSHAGGGPKKHSQSWLQMSYTRIGYYNVTKRLSLGTYIKGYYSTRGLSETYQASMMQAGAFTPTMNSLFNYNPAYRAYQYGALGLMPVYKLNDILQLRAEVYGFFPYRTIKEEPDGGSYYAKPLRDTEYIGELTLACKFSALTLAAWADYYTSHPKSVKVGLTLGWFMFNERFIE
ncbi:MAG: patatin-like phospholipase family protein [Bacteroidaceae bacterium]|nr:patatin-like phospholipase family protein [Bacteroidaceae bacterium]